jgi:hypothetical protein
MILKECKKEPQSDNEQCNLKTSNKEVYNDISYLKHVFLFHLLSKYFQCRLRIIFQQVFTPNVWIYEVVKKVSTKRMSMQKRSILRI